MGMSPVPNRAHSVLSAPSDSLRHSSDTLFRTAIDNGSCPACTRAVRLPVPRTRQSPAAALTEPSFPDTRITRREAAIPHPFAPSSSFAGCMAPVIQSSSAQSGKTDTILP